MNFAPGVFLTRYTSRCVICAKDMPKASAAKKHRNGIMCAAHGRVVEPCYHNRSSWGICRECGSPVLKTR